MTNNRNKIIQKVKQVKLEKTDCEACRVNFTILDENLHTQSVKKELKDIFYDLNMTPVIVIPSGASHQGLLKFPSPRDADDFLQRFYRNEFPSFIKKYEFFNCPAQVLINMYAELSVGIVEQLSKENFEQLQNRISKNSGADLVKENDCMGLKGSLTDIEMAQQYLSNFLDEQDEKVDKNLDSKPVSLDMNVGDTDVPSASVVTTTSTEKKFSKLTDEKDEYGQIEPVILSTEEYKMLLLTNKAVLQQNTLSPKVDADNQKVVFDGDPMSLSELQKAQSTLQLMQTDELTDLTNKEMKKAEIFSKQLHPKVYLKLLPFDGESKIKIFGETYADVQAVKAELMITIGRQKETGHRKRTLPNLPETNSEIPQSTAVTSLKPKGEEVFKTAEGISVYVYTGDLLYLEVDCIVNASNKCLEHKHGIAGSIAKAAGDSLVQECRNHVQDETLPVGAAVVTQSGNLKHYKCIIHAVGPRNEDYHDATEVKNDLKKTVLGCFFAATKEKLNSVALPAISSGSFHVPLPLCVEAYVESVQEFSTTRTGDTSLQEIHFVDLDPNVIQLIESGFKNPKLPFSNSVTFKNSGGQLPVLHFPVEIQAVYDRSNHLIKRYLFGIDLTVSVCTGDILDEKYPVDAVVSSENEEFCGKGQLASLLLEKGGRKYREDHGRLKNRNIKLGNVTHTGKIKHLCFVVHAVMPAWDHEMSTNRKLKEGYFETLSFCISNILGYANKIGIQVIAFPLFGSGGRNADIRLLCTTLRKALLSFGEKQKQQLQHIYVVNMNEKLSREINSEFKRLEDAYFPKKKLNAAALNTSGYGSPMDVDMVRVVENQPPEGSFTAYTNAELILPGYRNCGTIEMMINFPSSKQTIDHPYPGKPYDSFQTVVYLPDSDEGRILCKLLEVAFYKKLLFKIAPCSGKEDKITWSQIPLKTNIYGGFERHGYPDSTYLSHLRKSLKECGVTEKDLHVKSTTV